MQVLNKERVEIEVFKHLKVYRKLCSKNKRSFIVYIPCEWVNGYNAGRVSLQLCEILPEGHAGVLIDLLDSGQVKK